jgi:hypothetical protein
MIGHMVECPKCRTHFAALKEETIPSGPQRRATRTDTPVHQNEVEPERPRYRRRIRRNNEGGSMLLGVLLTIGGGLLATVGLLMLVHYWLDYDTSVVALCAAWVVVSDEVPQGADMVLHLPRKRQRLPHQTRTTLPQRTEETLKVGRQAH